MPIKPELSILNLRQSISLYRALVSVMKSPLSEEEVVRFVVETIFDHYPQYRCSFSNISPEGNLRVLYSKHPSSMPGIEGRVFALAPLPELLQHLRDHKRLVADDLRLGQVFGSQVDLKIFNFTGAVARVDIPFELEEGNLKLLSLTSNEPQNWEESTADLLYEISELIALVMREARARAKLEESETMFRQFTDNVDVVFWMNDVAKRQLIYGSAGYERIWRRSVESLYKDPLSFLESIHPEDRERVRTAVMKQSEEHYEQVYRIVWPNGEVRWIKDRGFQVKNEEGEVLRVLGLAEDITPLRKAQQSLEASQKQVIANAKFAALGEMSSGIAHEINNPLAVIHGLAVQLQEYFRSHPAEPMVPDSLDTIERMANRIAGIVKGLRTFTRQTAGDPLLPADLNVVVQETMTMCEARLRAAKVEVTKYLPTTPTMIRCRSSEISQVLVNLVMNAIDAVSTAKERKISVKVEPQNKGVKIIVEDNGPGIPLEIRDRIFQPFFTTKDVGLGTGLGLSISKGIVESHGGALYFDSSAPNTRFVVEIP